MKIAQPVNRNNIWIIKRKIKTYENACKAVAFEFQMVYFKDEIMKDNTFTIDEMCELFLKRTSKNDVLELYNLKNLDI